MYTTSYGTFSGVTLLTSMMLVESSVINMLRAVRNASAFGDTNGPEVERECQSVECTDVRLE